MFQRQSFLSVLYNSSMNVTSVDPLVVVIQLLMYVHIKHTVNMKRYGLDFVPYLGLTPLILHLSINIYCM